MDDTKTVNAFTHIVKRGLIELSAQLELPINMTGTSKKRDLLTEANIHIHAARQKLQEALEQG